jgi:hypothetical protein
VCPPGSCAHAARHHAAAPSPRRCRCRRGLNADHPPHHGDAPCPHCRPALAINNPATALCPLLIGAGRRLHRPPSGLSLDLGQGWPSTPPDTAPRPPPNLYHPRSSSLLCPPSDLAPAEAASRATADRHDGRREGDNLPAVTQRKRW